MKQKDAAASEDATHSEPEQSQDRADELALKVLNEIRVALMMTFRFLDRALWKLQFERATLPLPLATDGKKLYYDPMRVISSFRKSPQEFGRIYLHSVLHCIFRQPFKTVRKDVELWSLCCDVCVEVISYEMSSVRMPSSYDDRIGHLSRYLATRFESVTPSKLYRVLLRLSTQDKPDADDLMLAAEIDVCREFVERDNHEPWRLEELKQEPHNDDGQTDSNNSDDNEESSDSQADDSSQNSDDGHSPEGGEDSDDADDGQNNPSPELEQDNDTEEGKGRGQQDDQQDPQEPETHQDHQAQPPAGNQDDEGEEENGQSRGQSSGEQDSQEGDVVPSPAMAASSSEYEEAGLEEAHAALNESRSDDQEDELDWEDIAQQVETELQTLDQQYGSGAGNLMANLALANRSRIDYESFLKRFATMREDMKTNDDEFDYIFYTHGLNLYGNMPLIEPLEYKEDERVREFVIALDTSGSCSHGLTRVFLTRTYEILTSTAMPGDQINVHIIQCDAKIQLDTVIKSADELKKYARGFEVHGNGGTDFRPVFSYVNELVDAGEFEDLRGVIYFTDGFGKFPNIKPDYEVAFVFVEEEGKTRRVPPWAMKVVMDEDHISELDTSGVLTTL